MLVYVDDILLLGSDEEKFNETVRKIGEEFEIRVEDKVKKFLEIICDFYQNGNVLLHSATAIDRILHQFNFENCRPANTPLPTGTVLTSDKCPQTDDERQKMKNVPYRELIGSLLYLANTTRPDISFAVGMLSRYMENPGTAHWDSACHVMRYLKASRTTGIQYKSNSSDCIEAYSDADFAGDRDTRKSTSGYVFTSAGGAISWRNKKRTLTAQSTVEAETISLSFAVRELLWLHKLLDELNVSRNDARTTQVTTRDA